MGGGGGWARASPAAMSAATAMIYIRFNNSTTESCEVSTAVKSP